MRPPLTLPLFLTLIAFAGPAGAQVKTNAGAETAAGTAGSAGASLNAGGVAPIGLTGSQVSPLSLSGALSPALAPPAASPHQGLAASALAPSVRPAAAASEKPAKAAAPAAVAARDAPAIDPSAAPAAAVAAPPVFFLFELGKLGVPEGLQTRLYDFLTQRHPGDQNMIYHGMGHSREVANLAAHLVADAALPAEKKILLILAAALHDVDPNRAANSPARVFATLEHLDKDDEARALLLDFGGAYGFTAAQVKALIMATDFDLDPARMKEKQDAFAQAAAEAFPSEPAWALTWGRRLAFADQTSSYVGTIADARKRVEGLALEIRTQLQAIGKGPGPSDEVILAGTYKFLSNLRKDSALFALLPQDQRANFDAVRHYFEARQTPESWQAESAPMPARAPPVNPDAASARRFIAGIMGGLRAPTERETDSLLGDWLDEQGIPKESPRAAAVRGELLPGKARAELDVAASLHPKLRRHAALLIRLASENKATVAHIESVMSKRGLLAMLDAVPDSRLENQIEMALTNDELDRAVAKYPDNAQGELMRAVAGTMATKGGKSVEEVARDGVFLYADFHGTTFARGYASRDPDIQQHTIAFYVTRKDGKWRIDGYRQKKSSRTSDAAYIDGLKSWLRKGGIPSSDLL
ncbi:MAG: HD domain-containing protein [Elusimicrobiota bacterium]|nr:HD domain-containing protein [Elusimicrobiota bacterium]